jgi:hypothetical protein
MTGAKYAVSASLLWVYKPATILLLFLLNNSLQTLFSKMHTGHHHDSSVFAAFLITELKCILGLLMSAPGFFPPAFSVTLLKSLLCNVQTKKRTKPRNLLFPRSPLFKT